MQKTLKIHPSSVHGKYYVDQDVCTFSGACLLEAPNNLKFEVPEDGAIVFKQPESPDEIARMKRAIHVCPVEAIMDDGD